MRAFRRGALLALAALALSLPFAFGPSAGSSAPACGDLTGLEAADLPLRLSFPDATAEEVLTAIAELGGFAVDLEGDRPGPSVALEIEKTTVEGALTALCRASGVSYDVPSPDRLIAHLPAD